MTLSVVTLGGVVTLGAQGAGSMGEVLAATRAAQVAATPAGVKITRLATCCRVGTDTGFVTSSARAREVAGRLVGGWVALTSETRTHRPPPSR